MVVNICDTLNSFLAIYYQLELRGQAQLNMDKRSAW